MGQAEILKFLQKNKGKWFYIKEISENVRSSYANACLSLNKLYKQGYVLRKDLPSNWSRPNRMYMYNEYDGPQV